MSRFYGSMTGQAQTEATRRGSAASGVQAHVRGWDKGIRVEAFDNGGTEDGFRVWITSGSNGGHQDLLLAEVTESDLGFNVSIGERFKEMRDDGVRPVLRG